MKKITLFIIFAFTFNFVNAQFSLTSNKEANKIKNSKLFVVLEEEDPKTISKLKKKKKTKELKHYKAQIEGRNKALKNAVENYWIFSEDIEYVNASKVKQLVKEDKSKNVYLQYGKFIEYEKISTNSGLDGKPAGWNRDAGGTMTYNKSTKYTELANEITSIEIGDPKAMIKVYLPNVYPSEADVAYGMQVMQFILNYLIASTDHKIPKLEKHIKSNAPELKNLTLLIDKNELHDKLTEKEIKEVYPYAFKLVDGETIDKAILDKDPKYAVVQIVDVPGGKGDVSTHYIMGTGTGELYGFVSPKVAIRVGSPISMGSFIKYNERIKSSHLEKYSKHIEKD